ncbi:polysaccharide deacetylase family protein [Planosporangium mesophilum]|uniref:Lipoprotein n=1 Tax=Planosporangium mesophilum TaxID=689768 RepID=A0A8J3T824_9ACTN|nr:polysaccharide deacetylase family protein [Planosporangium mesophilum]GII20791.1 lipoprotein [Planosporangium mesophilum]
MVRTPRLLLLAASVLALALSACARGATADPGGFGRSGASASPASPTPSPSPSALPGATRAGLRPPVVTNGPRTGNKVALTFDADMTDSMLFNLASGRVKSYANIKVIDILESRQVPATFFLTGEWAERYPDVARRLAADPRFELGNHSYKHQGFTPNCYQLGQVPPNLMTEDVARTFRVIEPFGGHQTRYFRFPGGCHDEAALAALAPLGVTVIQWDVVSGDPFATAAAPIVHAVLSQVKAGSIVVLHVTEANAQYTDEALPPILDGLRAKGLQPVTLSELLSQQ